MDASTAALLSSAGSALLVLLGGAGGVLFVWWLDGIRVRRRERRSLTGALELVTHELGANIVFADEWAILAEPERRRVVDLGPIELTWSLWEANANELARELPRDVIGRLAVSYTLARTLMHNAEVAQRRGHLVEQDIAIARRVRDLQQASLDELQAIQRKRLRVRFT